jgi:hypothetical protein
MSSVKCPFGLLGDKVLRWRGRPDRPACENRYSHAVQNTFRHAALREAIDAVLPLIAARLCSGEICIRDLNKESEHIAARQ